MSLSLTRQHDGTLTPEDPGIATHRWVKELYFEHQDPDKDVEIPDNIKQKIKDYIQTATDYKHKRNWEGADQQYRNSLQFAKELGIELDQIETDI